MSLTERSPHRVCTFECLESRQLLSSLPLTALVARPLVATPMASSASAGFTPSQIRHVYNLDRLGLIGGAAADGTGQTIAIVNAFDHPTIAADLNTFDAAMGLPAPPSFRKVDQTGGTRYPRADAGWAVETALDVQWAHAIAPGASILLVEANSASLGDMLAAVDYARRQPNVTVVSMSWGLNEFSAETTLDPVFSTPAGHEGVTFVAAAGDDGAPGCWPAMSPNVIAVGGTTLKTAGLLANYRSESGWSYGGGGISAYEPEPSYQRSVQGTGRRTTPDVAYNADPRSGFLIYNTFSGTPGWSVIGGTSAGAPQWAAIVAIANQGRAAARLGSLAGGPAELYKLPAADFHDVASGTNGFASTPGYDLVTGRGTPLVNNVVRDLVATGSPAVSASRLGWPAIAANAGRALTIYRAKPVATNGLSPACSPDQIASAWAAAAEAKRHSEVTAGATDSTPLAVDRLMEMIPVASRQGKPPHPQAGVMWDDKGLLEPTGLTV